MKNKYQYHGNRLQQNPTLQNFRAILFVFFTYFGEPLQQTGMQFLRKEVAVCFRAGQGSISVPYQPILSHLEQSSQQAGVEPRAMPPTVMFHSLSTLITSDNKGR